MQDRTPSHDLAHDLVRIAASDNVKIDFPYCTENNFVGQVIYHRETAMLHRAAMPAFAAAVRRAQAHGVQLVIKDAFRPHEAQQMFWQLLPDERYVADPAKGGIHTRGIAIDATLADPASTLELDMGTGFDDMSERSAPDYTDLPAAAIANRRLLRHIMCGPGIEPCPHNTACDGAALALAHAQTLCPVGSEWWHFNLPDVERYPFLRAADVPDGPIDPRRIDAWRIDPWRISGGIAPGQQP